MTSADGETSRSQQLVQAMEVALREIHEGYSQKIYHAVYDQCYVSYVKVVEEYNSQHLK